MHTRKCLEYRYARTTDDLKTIGKLLYQTDPFIYPEFFCCEENAEEIVEEAIRNNLYCFGVDNIFCAFDGKKPVAMVCKNPYGEYKWDYGSWKRMFDDRNILNQKTFDHVADGYFEPLNEEKFDGQIYVLAVCVLDEVRGQGIGTELMKRFVELHDTDTIVLDTLANNAPAVALYVNCGFKAKEYYYGFSTTQSQPNCIRMERKVK